MNRIVVATWNAEGMFTPPFSPPPGALYPAEQTRRATPENAVQAIAEIGADVVVIPEFGQFGALTEATRTALGALGYTILEVPYDDHCEPAIMMGILSRLPIRREEMIRLGDRRNAGGMVCVLPGGGLVRIAGVHLDDNHEEWRLQQAESLVGWVDAARDVPTLIMGDFNAMDDASISARVVRAIPVSASAKAVERPSVLARLSGMATGGTIRYMRETSGLNNLDPRRRHTISPKRRGLEWAPAIRLVKIDWMFGSPSFVADSYRVWRDVGSDHRPIRAELRF